jgi:threonine aldolase
VQLRVLDGASGIFTAEQVRAALNPPDSAHSARSRLVSIEQTTNAGGGACWRLSEVAAVADAARNRGLAVHMDGARLLNAVVATGTRASEFGALVDSVWIDLSKGLGAPVGAVLAGGAAFIAQARRVKQRLGGAMRQSGILAAAGLHALDHHVQRLSVDHLHARQLAERLAEVRGVDLNLAATQTNIVVFDIAGTGMSGDELIEQLLREHGVRLSPMGGTMVRAVTHMDVDADQVATAADAIASVLTAAHAHV